MSTPTVVVHRDPDELAAAVAARLITRLVDAQAARGVGVGRAHRRPHRRATLQAVRDSPARDAVDWSTARRVVGRRAVPAAGDPERNETQAREALLDALPLDPARVHPMPPSDGPDGDDPEAAAAAVRRRAAPRRPGPRTTARRPPSTCCMLGVGQDGHVASLFPEHPAVYETAPVVAVRGCPEAAADPASR